jgi:DNA polymerase-3 subunit gamma/tau
MGDTKPTPSSPVDGASAADPAAVRAPAAAGAAASPRIDTAQDPWAKAVEQAPGVWVIGSETNVGKTVEPSVPAHSGTASQVPDYEPATAQIPQATPSGMSEADASWGLSPGTGGAPDNAPFRGPSTAAAPESPAQDGPSQGERMRTNGSTAHAAEQPPAASEPAESREYAMAAAGPAAAALQPAPATSQSAAAARQSLYQRLSNSPEAEAGRAKAPARAAATTYVQDIPSADDETIEESGVFGRAAVERILGGKLIEERAPDGSPIDSRF